MSKTNVGDIVAIKFLDHCHSSNVTQKPILFEAFGRVVSQSNDAICIASWIYTDKRMKVDHQNNTVYTIVRAAIKSIEVLRNARHS